MACSLRRQGFLSSPTPTRPLHSARRRGFSLHASRGQASKEVERGWLKHLSRARPSQQRPPWSPQAGGEAVGNRLTQAAQPLQRRCARRQRPCFILLSAPASSCSAPLLHPALPPTSRALPEAGGAQVLPTQLVVGAVEVEALQAGSAAVAQRTLCREAGRGGGGGGGQLGEPLCGWLFAKKLVQYCWQHTRWVASVRGDVHKQIVGAQTLLPT